MSSSVTISAKRRECSSLSMLPAYFMRMLYFIICTILKFLFIIVYDHQALKSVLFLSLGLFWSLGLRNCTTFSPLNGLQSICRTRHFFLTVLCPQMQCKAELLINAVGKGGGKLNREEKFDFGHLTLQSLICVVC